MKTLVNLIGILSYALICIVGFGTLIGGLLTMFYAIFFGNALPKGM